jgi:hypothetical protein
MNSHILTKVRPTKLDQPNEESPLSRDRLAKEESLDVEICPMTKGLELRAPKMVDQCLEPRSALIAVSAGEDSKSSMGESIHSDLSLLNNYLQLPSYLRGLFCDYQQTGRGGVASTISTTSMRLNALLPVDTGGSLLTIDLGDMATATATATVPSHAK